VLGVLVASCDRRQKSPPNTGAALSATMPSAGAKTPSAASPPSASAKPEARCITPESVNAVPLPQLSGAGADERAAIAAVSGELLRVLEQPADYFASAQTAGDLVLLELWHKSAFLPENCRETRCARCRTQAYDPKKHRIVSTKVWEQLDSAP
jgi:hypothetical protein